MKIEAANSQPTRNDAAAISSGPHADGRPHLANPSQITVLTTVGLLNAVLWGVLVWAVAHMVQAATNGTLVEPSPLFSDRTVWIIALAWPMSIASLLLTSMAVDRQQDHV